MRLKLRNYLSIGAGFITLLIAIIFGFRDEYLAWYKLIIPTFILVFGYTFILNSFNKEVEIAQQKLLEIFGD